MYEEDDSSMLRLLSAQHLREDEIEDDRVQTEQDQTQRLVTRIYDQQTRYRVDSLQDS